MNGFTVLDFLELELKVPNNLDLRCLRGWKGLGNLIRSTGVSESGLALTGFFDSFYEDRIHIIGKQSLTHIKRIDTEKLTLHVNNLFGHRISCILCCDDMLPPNCFQNAADKAQVLVTAFDKAVLSDKTDASLGCYLRAEANHSCGYAYEVNGLE